ncbi:ankyrin repeat, SAM and basic leucine zipper domain-containing protein 1 [Trichonephila clavata]|uniref:Ankyrin repeat, SAM and basic leucine zipper domain-containing protein 1 n=1 Tax=Trichonephila clavata TaxID=2740835 RepID=A0A8X6KZV1_TRICU|nr:ankyrin repeat, SAM and basic leucine zipper domain-containing protein 1 [Trichonephila clavata]
MVTVAGGMESDFSDSDGGMYFSNDIKKNSQAFEEKKPIPNGSTLNRNESRYNNNRNSKNFRPYNRNRFQPNRRQCLDFKSSQTLDDLRYAVMQGNLETTKNIISKDICVDAILKAGWTALMYASSSGQEKIVSFLLEKGADPNYHKDMFTPLMATCASKKPEEELLKCCTLLLQHGAKVNAHERHYTTPLMFAAREGYSLIVKSLIDHGVELNRQDNRGITALAWAAYYGHGHVLRILIEKGADPTILNNVGQSPIDLAYECGHTEVASLLEKGRIIKESLNTESCTDLVVKKSSDIKEISKQTDSKNFVRIGEMELFLSGIDCSDCIPKFIEHQLEFHDLLVMDDSELEKIGITQVGVRKKILEACQSVHKKEWENSSLPNLKQRQYISCPDAVTMMANISKHLKYISTSVIYIRQQIQSQPRILELSQDTANVHDLLDEMDDSLKNVHFLNDELRFLKMHLEKVQDQVQYIPADLIVETIPTRHQQKRLLYVALGMTILSGTVAGILWKNPNIFDMVPFTFRIKVPFFT